MTEAVITVPAYFNDAQRQATKDAGKIAGLEVLRIINEPTAAALAYGLDKKKDEKIAVFDLGGGTYDISILELGDGVFEVKSTNGDTHLGGDDFDQRVIDWLVDEFKKDQGIDLSQGRHGAAAPQGGRGEGEDGAVDHDADGRSTCPSSRPTQEGPKHLNYTLTRAKFEQLVDDLVQRTMPPMKKALEDAGLKPGDVDEVILVGGSTRIPKIQEIVKEFFGKEPAQGREPGRGGGGRGGHPGRRAGGRREGRPAAGRDAAVAGHRDAGRRDDDAHPAQHDDPDEEGRDVLHRGGQPDRRWRSTCCRASGKMASDNKTIGKFQLTGIPPAPRGMPQIEVTFDIDANGILHVSAKDRATGKEQKIRIEASSGLSDSEIDRMVKDAESHAKEDEERRAKVEARNQLDSLVYQVEKDTGEWGDKVSEGTKAGSTRRSTKAKEALKGDDLATINSARDELMQAFSAAGQEMYQARPRRRRRASAEAERPPSAGATRRRAGRCRGGRGRGRLRDRRRGQVAPAASAEGGRRPPPRPLPSQRIRTRVVDRRTAGSGPG